MNNPKRHHFVPRMLLRRFTDENGRLHFFDKRIAEKGVLSSSPANVFVESHLYTQHGKDGEKDVSVETMFASLEGEADTIVEKIICAAHNRDVPYLTASEKATWDHFMFFQWKRVPDMLEKTLGDAEFEEHFEDSLKWYEATIRPLTSEEREKMSNPSVRAGIRHDARAKAVSVPGKEAVQAIAGKGLLVALIPKPNKSFIIGSHPIVKLTYPGRSNLSDSSVEVWFPLACDVAVTPGFPRGTEKLIEIKENSDIRYINESIFKQSTVIAGRSPILIASLANAR